MTPRITLVRHGRSAHPSIGWLDAEGLRRWLAAYDVAGITADDLPPAPLRALAARAGLLVASDLPRAVESVERLSPGARVLHSPLLRETALPIPELGRLRLPLAGWALAIGLGAAYRHLRGTRPPADVRAQCAEAAAWLADLAAQHGDIVAVTHSNVRIHIAAAFRAIGWQRAPGGGRFAHWSAWTFTRATDPTAGGRSR